MPLVWYTGTCPSILGPGNLQTIALPPQRQIQTWRMCLRSSSECLLDINWLSQRPRSYLAPWPNHAGEMRLISATEGGLHSSASPTPSAFAASLCSCCRRGIVASLHRREEECLTVRPHSWLGRFGVLREQRTSSRASPACRLCLGQSYCWDTRDRRIKQNLPRADWRIITTKTFLSRCGEQRFLHHSSYS
jgi:hypothetical protein